MFKLFIKEGMELKYKIDDILIKTSLPHTICSLIRQIIEVRDVVTNPSCHITH